jgi:LysM repeat protein
MSYHCPICDKAGLPDYTKEETICPQCNSDLKPFLLLHSISEPKKSNKKNYIIAGVSLIAIILLAMFIHTEFQKQEMPNANSKQIVALKDSLNSLNKELAKNNEVINGKGTNESKVVTIHYTVKRGDYLYKIAKFFYGDGRKYNLIEKYNNLKQPRSLKVGQLLTIKIKQ